MPATIKKLVVRNPQRKRQTRAATTARKIRRRAPAPAQRKAKRKNPGVVTLLGLTNPTPRKHTMKKQTRKKNAAPKPRSRRRRNPTLNLRTTSRRHRRRNPNLLSRGTSTLKLGIAALLGLIAVRQVPQMFLGQRNSGIWGYLANFATLLAATPLAMRLGGREAGQAFGIGGSMYLAERILREQVSPIGKALSLSGVGDASAASPSQLRGYVDTYFPSPVVYDEATNTPILPRAIRDYADAAAARASAPTSAAQMAGLRFGRQ